MNPAIQRASEVATAYPGVNQLTVAQSRIVCTGFLVVMAELDALRAIGEYIDSRCVDDTNPCHFSFKDGEWQFCDWTFYPEHLGMGGDSFMEASGTGIEILAEIERLKGHRAELQADYEREEEDA